MIKKIFKKILLIIFCIIVICCAMTGIDYLRMSHGKLPVFCRVGYIPAKKTQIFKGVFYEASRKYTVKSTEPLVDSTNLKFSIFHFSIKLPKLEREEDANDFSLTATSLTDCNKATLYYSSLKQKVYLYCLDEVMVKQNGKEESLLSSIRGNEDVLEDIKTELNYTGLGEDAKTEVFLPKEGNSNVKVFQCHDINVNDVYFGPAEMTFQEDFCTLKDDDLKWIFEVKDETPETVVEVKDEEGNVIPEVFFEDEKAKYQFSLPKSNYIFITTPEVRGIPAKRLALRDVLNNHLLTIDEIQNKGLQFEKVEKTNS